MCSNCGWDNEPEPVDEELLFCQHEGAKHINLSTATLDCSECGEVLVDLNPQVSQELRVSR